MWPQSKPPGLCDFDAGLFGRLRAATRPDWEAYVDHRFVRELGAGTLPTACFRRFLSQEYLFLLHFARAWGLLAFKSTDLGGIRAASAGLAAILAEIPLHVTFSAAWGLGEAEMSAEPEAAETMLYTRYVLDTGMSGDTLDLLTAIMPCVAGYAEIGMRLAALPTATPEQNPYRDWITAYQSEPYQSSVAAAIDAFNQQGADVTDRRLAALTRIFATATRLEAAFWSMGLAAQVPDRNVWSIPG
jgi:thiaminase/transcriptional activator TenA